ncbi:RNA polymerase sigma-70 factor [Sphingobacterium sp. DK4209]|uniref:RNA polymerase sigma-70 factor n=1 Tax=Sphingobacterium zhuxiongii TaxID=2662364 RepID=A0A5Q0QAZ6_9SPHI|nr:MULTISPECIES: RNA polymerase sigma-70 factor [unclassified Sphingobacterium]MVZ65337.1 RNA polymerase sigma-70 factor [Sphingobacterium sp. DK4209]QGA26424.1 RNA polymerase sigma-70 factor [Sphingobacterium sp. dk4302]
MKSTDFNPSSENELLTELCSGNQNSFEIIYYQYSARLYANILKMVKVEDLAQELLQEIFIKVWEKRHLIDPEQPFKGYLFKIAKNTVYNFFRKHNIEQQVHQYLVQHSPLSKNDVQEKIDFLESEQLLNDAIAKLSPQRRRVFVLCKLEGKSYAEVSQELGISVSTVNDHIVKAMKFIKSQNQGNSILLVLALFNAITESL